MIKVNLLKDHASRTRKTMVAPKASPLGLMFLAALALAAVGLGATWYYLRTQITDLTASRDKLRLESVRLQGLKKQADQFEKMKNERQSRIDIIEQLRANQKGPVLLLNHLIRCIPTSAPLWLTSLEQKGDQIRIMGSTTRGETIPDFMSNLSATGIFKTVDLELYEDKDQAAAKFTLLCVTEQQKASPE